MLKAGIATRGNARANETLTSHSTFLTCATGLEAQSGQSMQGYTQERAVSRSGFADVTDRNFTYLRYASAGGFYMHSQDPSINLQLSTISTEVSITAETNILEVDCSPEDPAARLLLRMTYSQTYPDQHAYPSPTLSFDYHHSIMADWSQQNPEDNPQHPFNYLTPIDTHQQTQYQFPLPPQHVLDYLSPPMPPSPYTPQSVQSPTPPQLDRIDSFASSYSASQHAFVPPQIRFPPTLAENTFSPSLADIPYPPPPPRTQRPRSRGRAVCIGVNYFNQKGEMKGRTDEARNLSSYLQQVKHYTSESIILLTDDQNGPFGQPTKRNILNALHWLGEHAFQGERIVVYYSGHGKLPALGKKSSSARAAQGQQDDVETIYPVDFRSFKEGMIKPEELEELLEPVRRKGAKLTLILDTHAGIAGKKKVPSN